MDYQTAKKKIIAYFATQWGNTVKVAYPDVDFKTPNNQPWARFNIKHFDGFQASMGAPGSNRFRRAGLITLQIFYPQGKAALQADVLADNAVNIFRGVQIDGITYYDVQMNEIGNDGAGWYQINVLAYFKYDHIA